MQFTFKIIDKIKEVWTIYKAHFSVFLLLMIVTLVAQFVGSNNNWMLSIISFVVGMLVSYIWVRFVLSLIDKKEFNPFARESLPSLSQFWNLFKTMLLLFLCVLGGLILFIIPAFYVSARLMFAVYISIEKNQGARASIKESWEMTKGYGWKLFWKSFLIGLFIALGFVLFFIGSFITYPIGMMVFAMLYREFSKFKSETPVPTPVEIVS